MQIWCNLRNIAFGDNMVANRIYKIQRNKLQFLFGITSYLGAKIAVCASDIGNFVDSQEQVLKKNGVFQIGYIPPLVS